MNNEIEKTSAGAVSAPYSKTTRSKGSKPGRFNLVDFFLLLIILAIVAALVVYIVPGIYQKLLGEEETEITFALEFRGVDVEFISNINVGDSVHDAGKNVLLGQVKSVEHYADTVLVYNEATGEGELRELTDKKNVIITVTSGAVYTDKEGYSVNGERIAVGRGYDVGFPNFSGSAYCIDVSASVN